MASGAHQKGIADLLNGTLDYLTDSFKWMLLKTGVYTYNPDTQLVDAGGANDILDAELGVGGYTGGWGGAGRKTLASKTVSVNDTNNRVELDAADASWTALAVGETIEAAEVIHEGGSDDTTSRPLAYLDPSNLPTNGSDIALQVASNGWLNFNC